MIRTRSILPVVLSAALIAASLPVSAQAQGQISGIARGSNGQALVNQSARLRNVNTGQIVSNVTTNATGEFSFTGLSAGNYLVEVVNAAGTVIGTTSPVTLTAATMVVSGLAVTSTAGTIGTFLSGLGIGSFFTSTAGIITAAAVAGGLTAGIVTTKGSASTSN
jgi:hypothetical protein